MNRRTLCGFTLMELMLCIAIILLLAGLLTPVLLRAKESSKLGVCTSQLRQIGQATLMYVDIHGELPTSLDKLSASGLVNDKRLLLCASDEFGGFFTHVQACFRRPVADFPISYDTSLSWPRDHRVWQELRARDPNHGIVVCRSHGTRGRLLGNDLCNSWFTVYSGLLLRLRVDGSVQRAKYSTYFESPPGSGEFVHGLRAWDLYTDAEPPDWWRP